MGKRADLRYERKFWKEGVQAVAGVDEVGVGPMAGPVVAAAVCSRPRFSSRACMIPSRFRPTSARSSIR